MKLNIFRNPFIDAQVSMLMGTLDDARRRETEEYWRYTLAQEIRSLINDDTIGISIYEHGKLLCPECGVRAMSWVEITLNTAAEKIEKK